MRTLMLVGFVLALSLGQACTLITDVNRNDIVTGVPDSGTPSGGSGGGSGGVDAGVGGVDAGVGGAAGPDAGETPGDAG